MNTLKYSAEDLIATHRWPADTTVPQRLQHIYEYWRGRGFSGIVLQRCLTLLALLFMVAFSLFLALFIDYTILFEEYSLGDALIIPQVLSVGQMIFCGFISLFLLFWIYQFFKFIHTIIYIWDISLYCSQLLGINSDDIKSMTWDEVLNTLSEEDIHQRTLIRNDQKFLSHLEIINIIMQQENYMIGLVNSDVLEVHIPLLGGEYLFLTKAFEWGLQLSLFNYVFSHEGDSIWKKELKEKATVEELASNLRYRFRLYGIIGLIVSPFVFVSLLIYFFFKYGEQVKNAPGKILGGRDWTPLARWKFREWNELPHIFEDRLKKSFGPANTFVDSFDSYPVILVAQFLSFVIGSFVVVLLVAAIYDDHFLLETQIGSRNALLLLGILGSLLAVVREFIPPDDKVVEPNQVMKKIAENTHYLPEHWIDHAHRPAVQREFFGLYRHKALLWLNEALGIIFAPIIMIFFLPKNAENIIQFFRDYTVEIVDLPMCRYARFDFKKLGNKEFLQTSPIIPDIPEESLSHITLKTTSQLPISPTETDDLDPDLRTSVSEYPILSNKRKTPQTLTGTQAIRGLLKDLGTNSGREIAQDEVIIDLYDEEDEEDKGKEKSKSSPRPRRSSPVQPKQTPQQRRRITTTSAGVLRSGSMTSMATGGGVVRPYYHHEDISLLQSSGGGTPGSVKSSKNGKMECSIINFISNYPKWTPLDEYTDRFIIDSVNRSQLKEHK